MESQGTLVVLLAASAGAEYADGKTSPIMERANTRHRSFLRQGRLTQDGCPGGASLPVVDDESVHMVLHSGSLHHDKAEIAEL